MKKFLFVPIAGAILSLGALTAQAAETFSIVLDPTPATVGVSGSAVPAFSSVSAGQFLVTPNGGSLAAYGPSFYTFCVELTQYYSNPAVAAYNYQVLASTGQVTATKLGWIGQLYTLAGFAPATGLPGVTADSSTAFQAAVWELVYENVGAHKLGAGNAVFSGGSVNGAALTTAQGWLDQIDGGTAPASLWTVAVLSSDTKQDYLVATPVPEPEGYALAFAGLACVGLFGRRLRTAKSA